MKACIQYDSKTGNTKQLADVIRKTFSQNLVDTPEQADVIFLGSWTDKGSCSQAIQAVAENLQNKKLFLFGTCGFGGSQAYYDQIFRRTAALLPASNQIIGHFYCQGKNAGFRKRTLPKDAPRRSREFPSPAKFGEL